MSNPYSFGGDPQNNPYGGASPYGGAPDPYNPYGAPPQVNPYGAANPYGAPPPQVNPYDASGYGQANYGAPPPGGYPYGGFDPNAQYGAAPPGYAYGGFPDPNAQYQADFRAGPSAPPAHPGQPGQPAHGAPGAPGAPGVPGDPNSQGGWSTGQKVAVGVGVGVAVTAVAATVAALGIGGGYLAYNHHEASSQNASPIKLHVKVISASNLKAADSGGTSDPYVVLKVGYCGAKTPTLQKTLNPRWDAQFDFGVHDKQIPKEFLEVEVFDKDLLSDDALGNVKIPLSAIGNQPHRQSVKLEHVKTGEITLELWFTGRH